MGANGGIEGNFNALNFDQNQEKIRKNHFGKWKH
jgi:hypothetical protein